VWKNWNYKNGRILVPMKKVIFLTVEKPYTILGDFGYKIIALSPNSIKD